MSLIGRSVKRLEDRPLLTGSGRFAADVMVPDMLYMRVVRSPVAFGRLTGLQIAEALAHPGTVAVWTAQDVADIPPIGFRMTPVPGLEPYRQPVLANGHVRALCRRADRGGVRRRPLHGRRHRRPRRTGDRAVGAVF